MVRTMARAESRSSEKALCGADTPRLSLHCHDSFPRDTQTPPSSVSPMIVESRHTRHDSHHLRLPFPAALNSHHLETFSLGNTAYLVAGSITHVVGAYFF